MKTLAVLRSVSLAALLLSGCATTYVAGDVSHAGSGQFGTLEHDDPVHGGIVIEQIDGKWRGLGIIKSYQLSPGEHSLGVRVNLPFYSSKRVVRWFNVKAGERYSIEAATDEAAHRWGFWILDERTGVRVDREESASVGGQPGM